MLQKPNEFSHYRQAGRERMYLNRDYLLASICYYIDYILQYRKGLFVSLIQEQQLKKPTGKHALINPYAKSLNGRLGRPEAWRKELRAYRGIYKWFAWDLDHAMDGLVHPETFQLVFDNEMRLDQYQILHDHMTIDDLIGINFALLTYLYRYQPLKEAKTKKMFRLIEIIENILEDLRKKNPRKDKIVERWFLEDDMAELLKGYPKADRDKLQWHWNKRIAEQLKLDKGSLENPEMYIPSYRKQILARIYKSRLYKEKIAI